MKDNLNIEELFKEKFSSFEGEVSPDAWANIQQGMGATGAGSSTAASTGLSSLTKSILIAGGIIAAGVTGIYLIPDTNSESNDQVVQTNQTENSVDEVSNPSSENTYTEPIDNVEVSDNQANDNSGSQTEDSNDTDNSSDISNTVGSDSGSDNTTYVEPSNGNGSGSAGDGTADSGTDNTGENGSDSGVAGDNSNSGSDSDNSGERPEVALPGGSLVYTANESNGPTSYSFTSNAENYESVKWNFGDGTTGEGVDVKHTFNKPGVYEIEMTIVGEEEIYTENQTINVIPQSRIDNLPNFFTPNGDYDNDLFYIATTGIETLFVRIYDGNGNVVFESEEVGFVWDGTDVSGNKLEKGKYIYEFFAKGFDGNEIKRRGEVSLL